MIIHPFERMFLFMNYHIPGEFCCYHNNAIWLLSIELKYSSNVVHDFFIFFVSLYNQFQLNVSVDISNP